jgi:hypothetical protein
VAIVIVLTASSRGCGDEEARTQGLIGRYRDGRGVVAERVDRSVSFHWNGRRPDRRLSSGRLTVRWRGYLESETSGEYRLYAYGSGRLTVRVNGQTVLEGEASEPQWFDGRPLTLDYDQHTLEIEFHAAEAPRQLAFFWSGPTFAIEPLPPAALLHDVDGEATDAVSFAGGESLYRALRCEACHALEGSEPLAAPALDRLPGRLHRAWLIEWLCEASPEETAEGAIRRRMPHIALSAGEASDLADYLLRRDDDAQAVGAAPDIDSNAAGPGEAGSLAAAAEIERGRAWFMSLGCLACHPWESLASWSLFDGGELSHVAAKRPASFFAEWLADPADVNRDHRMPRFELSHQQQTQIAVFLATQARGTRPERQGVEHESQSALREPIVERRRRGRELFVRQRCHACHRAPDDERLADATGGGREQVKRPLSAQSNWDDSCCGLPRAGVRPGYRLAVKQRTALRRYVSQFVADPRDMPLRPSGAQLVEEFRCLGCHERELETGMAQHVAAIVASSFGSSSPSPPFSADDLLAPSLTAIGDKLQDEALRSAIERRGPSRRPWLRVQMPRFPLADQQLGTLAEYFRAVDRIPDRRPLRDASTAEAPKALNWSPPALRLAGSRLVTAEGFGCLSCHAMGAVEPRSTAPGTRGPALDQVAKIIRRPWFDRLLRQPARISRRLEMPSVQTPVRGVLHDELTAQLEALWHVLDMPDFQPPRPDPIRTVRQAGAETSDARVSILTDVVRAGETTVIKPLLVGFGNRHSLLYDLAGASMRRWSVGDVAHQRTEGKSWYWEVGGEPLWQASGAQTEWMLLSGDTPLEPLRRGQFLTELDHWRHIPGGIEFEHRLNFAVDHRTQQTLWIKQRWVGWSEGDQQGVRRAAHIRGLRAGQRLRLSAGGHRVEDGAERHESRQRFTAGGSSPSEVRGTIRVAESSGHKTDEGVAIDLLPVPDADNAGQYQAELTLDYASSVDVDRFFDSHPLAPVREAEVLDCMPGFRVTQLPISDEIMPTAIAWRRDGTLVVASLKGRVWLARDSDGDGLEDRIWPFSDELAAPYGLATGDDYVDVLHKSALLRLYDEDRDGRADRTETIASGWGHTDDYHDWAVGLPCDRDGSYFVALPCQQDERDAAAALLRGHVLRLIPQTPTPQDPRRFRVTSWATGQRFPMGLVFTRDGHLLASDNQGNFNPFNELNHIRQDQHYGFINRLERDIRERPPLTPPAINIPHPWTRSVNGICALELVAEPTSKEREAFGPFAGHLVGCEYDTRRLIRMTLQQVDGQLQGAAYPLSLETVPAAEAMLGPVCCAVSPDGQLYIGSLRDSGWGAANNVGELLRIKMDVAHLPAGIRTVTATAEGFCIEFTRPVDRELATDRQRYSMTSYYRVSTPDYGGDDRERRQVTVRQVAVADDARSVTLEVDPLVAGRVYELHLQTLVDQADFFPADAYYTLNRIPQR